MTIQDLSTTVYNANEMKVMHLKSAFSKSFEIFFDKRKLSIVVHVLIAFYM